MGFSWGADVRVVFGIELEIPPNTTRFVKRLSEWQPSDGTLFSIAAKNVSDFEDVPETVRKRAKNASKDVCDFTPRNLDEDGYIIDDYEFSDSPEDVDDETRAFLAKLKYETFVHGEGDFDLEYNRSEFFSEAFDIAAKRLFGPESGLVLEFDTGGAHGEAEGDASERIMVMRCFEIRQSNGLDAPRGGASGVPWGCAALSIPTELNFSDHVAKIKLVMETFGLRAASRNGQESKIGWKLVTVASGG